MIAGNHDLTLHEGWYEENHPRWGTGLQVCVYLPTYLFVYLLTEHQARSEVMKLLKGQKAVDSGIVYLQDEAHEFQVGDGRRTWSVYGSPVSLPASKRNSN